MARLKAVGDKILVLIDKKAQQEKAKYKGHIIIPPAYEYMKYRLQMGRILDIGDGVTDPAIRVGRTAILHHVVESSNQNLLNTLPNGDEVRVVRVKSSISSYQLFGVFDEEDNIISFGQFIFCKPEERPEQIDEVITDHVTGARMMVTAKKQGRLYIPEMKKQEGEEDGLQINTEVIAVSSEETLIKPGDTIISDSFSKYPIDLKGTEYWIVQREFVLAVLHDSKKETKKQPATNGLQHI